MVTPLLTTTMVFSWDDLGKVVKELHVIKTHRGMASICQPAAMA